MTVNQVKYMIGVEGLTAREIGSILCVSVTKVQEFCRSHGIKCNGKPTGFKKTKQWVQEGN